MSLSRLPRPFIIGGSTIMYAIPLSFYMLVISMNLVSPLIVRSLSPKPTLGLDCTYIILPSFLNKANCISTLVFDSYCRLPPFLKLCRFAPVFFNLKLPLVMRTCLRYPNIYPMFHGTHKLKFSFL
jgi:hypothetical protein